MRPVLAGHCAGAVRKMCRRCADHRNTDEAPIFVASATSGPKMPEKLSPKMRRRRFIILFWFCVTSVLLFVADRRGDLNESGYCLSERRYLSEEEFVARAKRWAYQYVYTSYEDFTDDTGNGEHLIMFNQKPLTNPFIYRDFEHFSKINQHCCHYFQRPDGYRPKEPWDRQKRHWSRRDGFYGIFEAKIFMQEKAVRQSEVFASFKLSFSNCGKEWSGGLF